MGTKGELGGFFRRRGEGGLRLWHVAVRRESFIVVEGAVANEQGDEV